MAASGPATVLDLKEALTEFSKAFVEWQITSIALAAAFLYLTTVYWRLIWKFHSAEHLPSAVLTHLMWAIAWRFASTRLSTSWDAWQEQRRTALFDVWKELGGAGNVERANAKLSLIQELHPVGVWTVFVSAVAAVGSFAAPILQAMVEEL